MNNNINVNIDWALLSKQKNALLYSQFANTDEGQGLIYLIDSLQDEAIKAGAKKKEIFFKEPNLDKTKAPLMYEGWLIKKIKTIPEPHQVRYAAYNFKTDHFINPLYRTWEQLKSIIDIMKTTETTAKLIFALTAAATETKAEAKAKNHS